MHPSEGNFECDDCGRKFVRKYHLNSHIKNRHAAWGCTICKQKFSNSPRLQLHYSRGHNNQGQPYPECDMCGRIFTRKQNITLHMIRMHLTGLGTEIRCDVCQKTFSSDRNLKRHMNQLHNPEIQFPTCDICKKTFKAKHALVTHIQATHNNAKIPRETIKCYSCGKVFMNMKSLKQHLETFHKQKGDFKCEICPKIYTSHRNLRRHARLYHKISKPESDGESSSVQQCESCSSKFDNERSLRQHVKTVHSFEVFYRYCRKSLLKRKDSIGILYKCEYCREDYSSVYELKEHMRADHDKDYCLSTCNVCFSKFYSKETLMEHKRVCVPPKNVNSCNHCDKLFTDVSSLKFHTRIFHPQAQIADSNVTSTNIDDSSDNFKCLHCDRAYYSDRSLKQHNKMKHSTDVAIACQDCGKVCSNKYYLASHMKIVHSDAWSKCDYCNKQFKTKRNIRRHIEYTHLGIQRYKCIECETLFKEKRSLRKHVRTKHPDSALFSHCHLCNKRFESAKSCKIHLKLIHSFNMNTFPCDLCSVSFDSSTALSIHVQTKHLAKDEIYKCRECNLVFNGHENFDYHKELCRSNPDPNTKQRVLPRCIICMKDFSAKKTLKRHLQKFHREFDMKELYIFSARRRHLNVECEDCIKYISGDCYFSRYEQMRHLKDAEIFKCDTCGASYNPFEYSILRHYHTDLKNRIVSDLCTAEMSDESSCNDIGSLHETAEAESTFDDIKMEPDPVENIIIDNVKTEPWDP